ncbi:MAG: sugar phosphate isomerase/epimerase [Phycisphaerales bacterium]|nr:sugar phosphate isomerase/epimerase [Phycisphaerales bacterium]
MKPSPTRRHLLASTGAALAAATLASAVVTPASAQDAPAVPPSPGRTTAEPFGYCLNTATISGANLGIVEELEIAAKAGYQAVEPWLRDIEGYTKKGGSLKDLAKRISDLGLTVEDAIGFDEWIVDDDARRAKGLEAMKRDMDTVAQIGGKRIAAPPAGATKDVTLDLRKAAERYHDLLELGDKTGVQPLLELWGFSQNLSRVGEVAFVALEAAHPKASILLDVYHMYKGGSGFAGLPLLNGAALHVLHTNDYPAVPGRDQITDAHRIFPGDGVAPLPQILRGLHASGFRGYLSLELFNHDYWKQSPLKVAQTGIAKMREVVRKSLA